MGKFIIIKDADFSSVSVETISFAGDGPVIAISDEGVVTISCNDATAIYYTTDGTSPSTSSTLYNSSFTVTHDTTVKAVGVVNGMLTTISTKTYQSTEGTYINSLLFLPGSGVVQGYTAEDGTTLYKNTARGAFVVPKTVIASTDQYLKSSYIGKGVGEIDTENAEIYDWLPVVASVKTVTLKCNPSYYIGVTLVTSDSPNVSDSGWQSNETISIDVSDYNETVWLAINTKRADGANYSGSETKADFDLEVAYTV